MNRVLTVFLIFFFAVICIIGVLSVTPVSTFTGEEVFICDLDVTVDYWFHRAFPRLDWIDSIKVNVYDYNWREKKVIEFQVYQPSLRYALFTSEVKIKWTVVLSGSGVKRVVYYVDEFNLYDFGTLISNVHRMFTVTFKGVPEGVYTVTVNVDFLVEGDEVPKILTVTLIKP